MDLVIIVIIAIGIFLSAIVSTKLASWLSVWRKATKHGLSPSLSETIALTKFFQLEPEFLDACLQFKKLDTNISIKNIVQHHMADGDTLHLLDQMTEIKEKGLKFSFESAVLYDLSGKDLLEMAEIQNRTFEIELNGKSENNYHYFYTCHFKVSPQSTGWVDPNMEDIKWIIAQKIKKTLEDEKPQTAASVLENHLNEAFWVKLCHGIVLNQDINIMSK